MINCQSWLSKFPFKTTIKFPIFKCSQAIAPNTGTKWVLQFETDVQKKSIFNANKLIRNTTNCW